ncbi:probable prolyl 4-hydroxylase 6 isoform X1 [Arachis hypogaea]|uniref:probable prolyl 4-hydroxylase 6 isoform X1 n=1 Tax=Arachis hypogaea TaxID=3818 RepID=UPI000DEC2914|nr:probable prolyl 4-hydroxylase 6 isoform X1 [Arachis hypogaea]QHO17095.1 putative prolyl 4-hydroxylase [Arachis hypogaea]
MLLSRRHFLIHFISFLFLFADLSVSSIRLHSSDATKNTHGSLLRLNRGGSSVFDPTRVIQLSWQPRAFIYKKFLTDEECDHLITLAKDKLEKSMVADNESGKSIESEVRTSSGMFLGKGQDEVVAAIEARIAAWTFLPIENGESIQILHYENGQKYEPHFDYFHDKANQIMGGHRIATVLMYLSNVEKGGETIFPNAEVKCSSHLFLLWPILMNTSSVSLSPLALTGFESNLPQAKESQPKDESWSKCAHKGYAVKPEKGDALLFFSLHLDATTDSRSLHGSCPVIEGEKWSATKWIHVADFEKPIKKFESGGGDCADLNENCSRWARVGECEKNPLYMVGNGDVKGYCMKSCNVC